ncbi:MAG: DeoR/GlpR family DNA-binding transcription regulator [Armatimonadota bacterium]
MGDMMAASEVPLAAERRRRICELVHERGAVTVAELTDAFCIGANTIRHDLNILHKQGKLLRSHGGAVANDESSSSHTHPSIRSSHTQEKEWIAEAALKYMPDTGSVFIGSGSTTYQMALRIPQGLHTNVVTVSPEVAIHVSANAVLTVDLLGGRIRPADSYSTDCSLAEDALNKLHWEVAFMGATGIDVKGGITSIDRIAAVYEKKQMECASKVVVLCDASKLGSFSYAYIGPLNLINVLITDVNAKPEMIREIEAQGIEVVLAGPSGSDHR